MGVTRECIALTVILEPWDLEGPLTTYPKVLRVCFQLYPGSAWFTPNYEAECRKEASTHYPLTTPTKHRKEKELEEAPTSLSMTRPKTVWSRSRVVSSAMVAELVLTLSDPLSGTLAPGRMMSG